jgi:hypothetical protein
MAKNIKDLIRRLEARALEAGYPESELYNEAAAALQEMRTEIKLLKEGKA